MDYVGDAQTMGIDGHVIVIEYSSLINKAKFGISFTFFMNLYISLLKKRIAAFHHTPFFI